MVEIRKEQINLLRAYWSTTTYTATLDSPSDIINGTSLHSASVTATSGGAPDSATPSRGIVTGGGYNICKLRDADTGKGIFDTDGSPIFGLLTFSDPDYTLTYCKYVSGSLISVNFPSSGTTNVGLLFPEVINIKEVPAFASLIDQGGFSNGGPSAVAGAIPPLTNVWYVDPSTTESSPDGSISKPYANIQAAFDAAFIGSKLTSVGFTFECAPGSLGTLIIPDGQLDGTPVNIRGMVVSKMDGSGPQCIIDTLVTGVMASGSSIGFSNLQINTVSLSGPTVGTAIFDNCYLGNTDTSLLQTAVFNSCNFQPDPNNTLAADNLELRNTKFSSLYTITFSTSFTWDVVSERSFLVNGGLFSSNGTIIKSLGDPYAFMAADDLVTSTGGNDRWIYNASLLTTDKNLRLARSGADFTGVTVDVYPQAHDITVIDDGADTTKLVITSSATAVRIIFTIAAGEGNEFTPTIIQNLQV
jgi:hypothetical protein